jgi:hypothetical protein
MMKGGPQGDTRVNGLTGSECNPIDITKPLGPQNQICVNENAADQVRLPTDPPCSLPSRTLSHHSFVRSSGCPPFHYLLTDFFYVL